MNIFTFFYHLSNKYFSNTRHRYNNILWYTRFCYRLHQLQKQNNNILKVAFDGKKHVSQPSLFDEKFLVKMGNNSSNNGLNKMLG